MSVETETPKEQWLTSDGHIDPDTFYGSLLLKRLGALNQSPANGHDLPRWQGSLDASTRGLLRLVICNQFPEDQAIAILGQEGLTIAMTTHLENLSSPTKPNPNTRLEYQLVGQWLAEHGVS